MPYPRTPIEGLYLVGMDAVGSGAAGDLIPIGVRDECQKQQMKGSNETFTPNTPMHVQDYLVRLSCSGPNRLPGHRPNYPDADQNPPTSRDGYSDQHPNRHANAYQHGDQHPCADANTEPHGHPTADGHACAHADRYARARKYACSGSHADP
jgi:hypothetical protein